MWFDNQEPVFSSSLWVAGGLFMLLNSASANPMQPRAASTTESFTPSVTAAATTLSGTIDPDLVTSSFSLAAASSTATPLPNTPPGNASFPQCLTEDVGSYPPFCLPTDSSDKYPGQQYYVTWDTSEFSKNTTVTVELNYVDVTPGNGIHAWSSPKTPYGYGYVILQIDKDWLQGKSRNNLTMTLVSYDPMVDTIADTHAGPTISLTNPPVVHLPAGKNVMPNTLGLAVGIPVGIAVFALVLLGLFFGMKHHRKIDVKSITSRRKGYGVGKSRRQRMGKKGPIRIIESEIPISGDEFKDDPVELQERFPGRTREDSLGSLVSSPIRDNFELEPRSDRNVFQEEISRQRTGH